MKRIILPLIGSCLFLLPIHGLAEDCDCTIMPFKPDPPCSTECLELFIKIAPGEKLQLIFPEHKQAFPDQIVRNSWKIECYLRVDVLNSEGDGLRVCDDLDEAHQVRAYNWTHIDEFLASERSPDEGLRSLNGKTFTSWGQRNAVHFGHVHSAVVDMMTYRHGLYDGSSRVRRRLLLNADVLERNLPSEVNIFGDLDWIQIVRLEQVVGAKPLGIDGNSVVDVYGHEFIGFSGEVNVTLRGEIELGAFKYHDRNMKTMRHVEHPLALRALPSEEYLAVAQPLWRQMVQTSDEKRQEIKEIFVNLRARNSYLSRKLVNLTEEPNDSFDLRAQNSMLIDERALSFNVHDDQLGWIFGWNYWSLPDSLELLSEDPDFNMPIKSFFGSRLRF